MITVHHLENSRSQRILWLLEELELEYDIKHYYRDKTTMLAPKSLHEVHPLGKSPVITDGEKTIAESGAIVAYLIHKYGPEDMQFEPGSTEWLDCNYWMHYAEGSVMPVMLLSLVFNHMKTRPMPFFAKPIARIISEKVSEALINPNYHQHMAFVNAHLESHDWFVADRLSGADFQMIFPLEAGEVRGGVAQQYQAIQVYMNRIHARPAYIKALKRGGPYKLMAG